jgi:hypothetical protein
MYKKLSEEKEMGIEVSHKIMMPLEDVVEICKSYNWTLQDLMDYIEHEIW